MLFSHRGRKKAIQNDCLTVGHCSTHITIADYLSHGSCFIGIPVPLMLNSLWSLLQQMVSITMMKFCCWSHCKAFLEMPECFQKMLAKTSLQKWLLLILKRDIILPRYFLLCLCSVGVLTLLRADLWSQVWRVICHTTTMGKEKERNKKMNHPHSAWIQISDFPHPGI